MLVEALPRTHARSRASTGGLAIARELHSRLREHNLLTYASAIAFQCLIGASALVFLGVALLRPLGLQSAWTDHVAPALEGRLPDPIYGAIEYSQRTVTSHSSTGLLLFALVIVVWEVSGAIRGMMSALDRIHGYEGSEARGFVDRFVISICLAGVVSMLLLGAIFTGLAGTALPGWPGAALGVLLRLLVSTVLVWTAVTVVLAVAPSRREGPLRWVTAGSALTVVGWIAASVGFRVYIGSVVSFGSPEGVLATVLLTTGYLYVCAVIFLLGAELDDALIAGRGDPVRGATKEA
jgi:membrane protein